MNDILLYAVLIYLGVGVIVSFFMKTEDKIEAGWSKGLLFLGVLLFYAVVVLSWPKELADNL